MTLQTKGAGPRLRSGPRMPGRSARSWNWPISTISPYCPAGLEPAWPAGVVTKNGGVVLDLSHMNRILDIRIEDRLVKAEPGGGLCRPAKGAGAVWILFPAGPGQRQGLHPGRQRGHQRRRHKGGQIRGHPGLCAGPGGGAARRSHRPHRRRHHEKLLRPGPDPHVRGFGGGPGGHHPDHPEDQSQAPGQPDLPGQFSPAWSRRAKR